MSSLQTYFSLENSFSLKLRKHLVKICALLALFTAIVPFARAFFRVEVDYNEGWNIYNASIVAGHHLLYPARYAWTTVNYPMLSFAVMAQLHRLTHDYLFTARAVSLLSLIGCSLLSGAIVQSLTGSRLASRLAALYCLALFCASADIYVGMDDPQIFALVFFLAGLWIYLRSRHSLAAIAAAALLFVVGGCIKHSPIEFPLAVLIELALLSLSRAVWFSICGLFFAAIAVALNLHYGGPHFFSQIFAPRVYLPAKVLEQFVNVFGPLLLPFCLALYTAFAIRNHPKQRIAAILLATSLVVGGYFSGGQGVAINILFSALLAVAILIGIFCARIESSEWRWTRKPAAAYAPLLLFLWLIIPMILSGNWNPVRALRETTSAEKNFDADVAFLQSTPGTALCESLLRCYSAGKPYLYDPFNATRLIHFNKLDAQVIVEAIHQHRYGAIQLDQPIGNDTESERFDPAILAALKESYAPALEDRDAVIYVPR